VTRRGYLEPLAPTKCFLVLAALLAVAAPPPQTTDSTIRFENIVESSGIAFVMDNYVTPEKHQVETMLAGVAVFDYNNDGLLDIYFANGAKLPFMDKSDPRFWNRLYRNNGDGTFTDVTEKAGVKGKGYSMGVAVGDYDNDGCEDLYITGVNVNQLLHNNCNGTFTDVTEKAGLAGIDQEQGKIWAIGAGWFDYDNDGRLDLLVVNYVRWSIETEPACSSNKVRAYCSPDSYTGLPNMLFHNNGDGTFTDVSGKSGISKLVGKGMGVAFADYDGDGFMDAFISNDTYRNFLLHNEGNGTFTETGILNGVAYNENGKSIAAMGCDFRDVDNDGRPDIFVTGMIGDTWPLFRNRGRDFQDITGSSGIARASAGYTGWGAGMFDFDNDGWKDLFATRASILDNAEEVGNLPSKLPNAVFRNLGGRRFADVSGQAGPSFQVPQRHRGAAFGDLNNDGKIDVVVVSQHVQPEIFINRSTNRNHWLIFDLRGVRSNRDGLGTRIVVTAGSLTQYNHATTSVGYSTSSDRRVQFGLGSATLADTVEIIWPSRIRQVLHNVKADQIVKIREE